MSSASPQLKLLSAALPPLKPPVERESARKISSWLSSGVSLPLPLFFTGVGGKMEIAGTKDVAAPGYQAMEPGQAGPAEPAGPAGPEPSEPTRPAELIVSG